MNVIIHIHKTHRQYTDGLEAVKVEGNTVGTCFNALVDQFPQMRDILFDENGEVNRLIEIYLNMESAYPDELKKKVVPEDEIYITVMLSGG